LKSTSVIVNSGSEKYGKHSTVFAVRNDEWNTKEVTSKSSNSALYDLQFAKRYLSD